MCFVWRESKPLQDIIEGIVEDLDLFSSLIFVDLWIVQDHLHDASMSGSKSYAAGLRDLANRSKLVVGAPSSRIERLGAPSNLLFSFS